MASLTSAAATIPSFTGLKAAAAPAKTVSAVALPKAPFAGVRASFREACVAAATSAVLLTAGNALAMDVLLGTSDGALVFEPKEFSVAAGEKITFKNNAGYPHNVIFDEDEVPSGVDVSKISMQEEDLLNAAGETFSVTLSAPGTYSFYCSPHQGAGMVGKVTVN